MFVPSEISLRRNSRRIRRRDPEGLSRPRVLVSPSLLMLAIQVMQQILKTQGCATAADQSAPKCSIWATISTACATAW